MNDDDWDKPRRRDDRPPADDDDGNKPPPRRDDLGSLAQSARGASLKQARAILIVVGVLYFFNGLVLYFNVENEARQAVEAEKKKAGPMVVFDPAEVRQAEEEIVRVGRLIYLGMMGVSVVFVVLGVAVPAAPVACTVTGLVLFLGLNALFVVADPLNLLRGIILKVIFLVCLVKAVQAAIAYERERGADRREARQARDDERGYGDD
ncbi:MAG: hypothetical protein C0501_03390 [Isosphaera sp.]|nr:hypothetical protein [Isosphaera sp.]